MIIEATSQFEKDYKRLAKKYPSISSDQIQARIITKPEIGCCPAEWFS